MRLPFKSRSDRRSSESPTSGGLSSVGARSGYSDVDTLSQLASAHLTPDDASRWIALLRPAVRLVVDGGSPVVARLGGLPLLPEDETWPIWEDHGPLSYIGEILCSRLAQFPLDIPMPTSGRLLFFYFDGSLDDGVATVGTLKAESLQGARAIFIGDDATCAQRAVPEGLAPYPEIHFAGTQIATAPGWEHPDLRAAFMVPGQESRTWLEHPVNADDFTQAVFERHAGPNHQIGGYADPIQGPVEYEIAQAALLNQVPFQDPRIKDEAARWELLFQVETDDRLNMMWGDCGSLYWLARPADLHAGNTSDISFTWQCS